MSVSGDNRWACLMYHDILPDRSVGAPDRAWFAVSSRGFAQHLDAIRGAGFKGCTIAQAQLATDSCVGISFDDGMVSDYEEAFPALLRHQMSATFFVVSDLVGTPGRASWSQLREMRSAGMAIESHTKTHPFLAELSREALRNELVGSKVRIDDELGQNTTQLAFPGGSAPRTSLMDSILEAGYTTVATSRWGVNPVRERAGIAWVRRCTVSGEPSPDWLLRVIHGDPLLSMRRQVREQMLGSVRQLVGPSRYARIRARMLGFDPPAA